MFYLSILAGVAIGLGCWIYCSVSDPILGALLFSCGLLAIRIFKYNLFTGKIQYMITKEYRWFDYLEILAGNIFGIMLMALLARKTPIYDTAIKIGELKASQPIWTAFIKGIGCGALMTIATKKETPLFVTSLCVLAFIAAGFNHCIADAFYFFAAGVSKINWLMIVLGNIVGGLLITLYRGKVE